MPGVNRWSHLDRSLLMPDELESVEELDEQEQDW
jgi:hypothetical protein